MRIRKLERELPALLTMSAVLSVITAIAFFIVGIWTPEWERVGKDQGFTDCDSGCWLYHGSHRAIDTGWLFLFIAAGIVVWRFILWKLDEDENHGH